MLLGLIVSGSNRSYTVFHCLSPADSSCIQILRISVSLSRLFLVCGATHCRAENWKAFFKYLAE